MKYPLPNVNAYWTESKTILQTWLFAPEAKREGDWTMDSHLRSHLVDRLTSPSPLTDYRVSSRGRSGHSQIFTGRRPLEVEE